MKTRQQIIDETSRRAPSDFASRPARTALVTYRREELLEVLGAVAEPNDQTRALLAGAREASARKDVNVVREHLLDALGFDWQAFDEEAKEQDAERTGSTSDATDTKLS